MGVEPGIPKSRFFNAPYHKGAKIGSFWSLEASFQVPHVFYAVFQTGLGLHHAGGTEA